MQEGSRKAIIAAFFANLGIAIAEAAIRGAVPLDITIYVKPDIRRTASA